MSKRFGACSKLGFLILALNSAYLWLVVDPSIAYVANLYLHVILGLVLLVPLIAWCRRPADLPGGWLSAVLLWVLLLGMLAGVAILWTGGTRPYSWLVNAHIAVAGAGFLAAALVLGTRAIGSATPRERRGWKLALAALILAALSVPIAQRQRQQRESERYAIRNPASPPLSMEQEGGGKGTEFFPSSIVVKGENTGSSFFMNSESCGRSGCHPDIVEQWRSSAHRFSSFNNQWYRKSIEYMQSVVGEQPSKWCGGCHDPAILLTGRMNDPVETFIDTPEAHVGLGCVMCHAVVEVNDTMGNAGLTVEIPALHDLATSENPLLQFLHDTAVRLDPEPHRRTFLKPFHREQPSEFCSGCHKVHLDVPVNHYRWIRGFNEYDAWQASGVSGHGARSFYYPPESSTCTKCHMPTVVSEDQGNIDGLVHNHRFAAANTALPVANQDEEQLRQVMAFLQSKVVRVDLFGLQRFDPSSERFAEDAPMRPTEAVQRAQTSFAEVEELGFATGVGAAGADVETLLAPLDREPQAVRRGESVRLEAVVRTLGVGHFFPGGTVDAFDVWLELKIEDGGGRTLFWSGRVEDSGTGPVEESAHFYRSFMLDARGNPINKRNAWATRSVLYVRLIPPGAADTVHFRFDVPQDAEGPLQLTAKLNYRKFSWFYTQFSFAGVRDPNQGPFDLSPDFDDGRFVFTGDSSKVSGKIKGIPTVPIVTMAEAHAKLDLLDADAPLPPAPTPSRDDLIRWNDYGIGLLLQGDLRGAEAAFRKVTELNPQFADGWVNIGRVLVQEGDPDEALVALRKALAIDNALGRANYFTGLALKAKGEYEQSLRHLERAAAHYPRDRGVLNAIGRVRFLQRDYDGAAEALQQVIGVDPEDIQAHYNLMLAYRGLGEVERAERERRLYLRFKADEASQEITGPYRNANPEDNNERQRVHEHGSAPLHPVYGDAVTGEALATDRDVGASAQAARPRAAGK